MSKKIIVGSLSVVAVIALVIAALIFFDSMNGQIVTTGQNPDRISGSSLNCTSSQAYPIFTYDSAKTRQLKITAGFYDGKVDSISLTYELYYDDPQQIIASEAHNHAAMNIDFGKNGLSADSYNANYAKMENYMRMALYIKSDKINSTAAKYFMINTEESTKLPSTLSEYQKNYESQGFVCKANNN